MEAARPAFHLRLVREWAAEAARLREERERAAARQQEAACAAEAARAKRPAELTLALPHSRKARLPFFTALCLKSAVLRGMCTPVHPHSYLMTFFELERHSGRVHIWPLAPSGYKILMINSSACPTFVLIAVLQAGRCCLMRCRCCSLWWSSSCWRSLHCPEPPSP